MRIFLAGIMQGSHTGPLLHDQHYRRHLKELLLAHFPGAEIYDPLADHVNSIAYDEPTGRQVFYHHNRMCRSVDMLLAFVPEASMGTAIEMWEAYQHGAAVITISPMVHNWAVKFLSHAIYTDAHAFEAALKAGEVVRRVAQVRRARGSVPDSQND